MGTENKELTVIEKLKAKINENKLILLPIGGFIIGGVSVYIFHRYKMDAFASKILGMVVDPEGLEELQKTANDILKKI